MESDLGSAHQTTPAGETGTADLREAQEGHGKGRVADAAGSHANVRDTTGHGRDLDDTPTGDDPFGTSAPAFRQSEGDGPTYERDQGTADQSTGGSTDPNNSFTHANSGDETEMPDQDNNPTQNQAVDGFADTEGESNVSSPDPGENKDAQPLSPEEYAEAQKEARSEEDEK